MGLQEPMDVDPDLQKVFYSHTVLCIHAYGSIVSRLRGCLNGKRCFQVLNVVLRIIA